MALNIYDPQRFRSQGIEDLATQETLTITNGKISVKNVAATESVAIVGQNFNELEGRGFQWSDGRRSKGLLYKQSKLLSDLTVNLAEDQSYQINDTDILTFSELGNTVTKSNLKVVGTLKTLKVSGNTELGDVVFVNSDSNKVGINTDSPMLALGLRENGVEVSIGSGKSETGTIGTTSSSHLDIVTDNTPRITISRQGDVRIHGKLIVDDLVTERTPWMMFKETATQTNYGKGILWSGLKGPNKQFVLQTSPDRLFSTESIDLGQERVYMIDREVVLNKTTLGRTVTESSLTKLGVLEELQVAGDAAIARRLSTNQIEIGRFVLNENELKVLNNFSITRNDIVDFSINQNITIGNSANLNRPVSIFGNLSIGLAQPQEGVSLTVEGPVSFDRKKFQVGDGTPTSGLYNKGDIVWNSDPKPTNYIGWVCVTPGAPGYWLPFGAISAK
jgi:hypothetical protein